MFQGVWTSSANPIFSPPHRRQLLFLRPAWVRVLQWPVALDPQNPCCLFEIICDASWFTVIFYADQSEELFTKPELWPQYSDQVMGALQEGKVIEEWDKFVAETAFFVLRYSNPKKSADYSTIGRLVCEKFPCVKFQEHGKSPWVCKCIYTDTQLRVETFRSFEMFTWATLQYQLYMITAYVLWKPCSGYGTFLL